MSSSSASPGAMSPMQLKQKVLYHLCIIQAAATQFFMSKRCIKYASSNTIQSHGLADFDTFLCKLAQVSDTEKGGSTNTALTCLLTLHGGAEIVFTSNLRRSGELSETQMFLEKLLAYVFQNPDRMKPKALQKRVLWYILDHNFPKVNLYLKALENHLKECIADFGRNQESDELQQLRELEKRVKFPCDMGQPTAKDKFLSDCETFIKAIHATKSSSLNDEIRRRTEDKDSESSYPWCQLDHHLGRLRAYRIAAEVIAEAANKWPDLFRSLKITPIPSAPRKRIPSTLLPESSGLNQIISIAFPETDLPDLEELRNLDLDEYIKAEIHDRKFKTVVHAEVNLHDYLVRNGKTKSSDFWSDSLFIATSKPPCQLCHYYFESFDNGFRVQPPHPNLYKKLRFPDDCNEDVLQDIIEQLEINTLQLIKQRLPKFKRNDSSTDTRGFNSSASHRTDGSQFGRISAQKGVADIRGEPSIAEEPDNEQSSNSYDEQPGNGDEIQQTNNDYGDEQSNDSHMDPYSDNSDDYHAL